MAAVTTAPFSLRRSSSGLSVRVGRRASVFVCLFAGLLGPVLIATPVTAQTQGIGSIAETSPFLNFKTQIRPVPPPNSGTVLKQKDAPMLVQANEINYDYNNEKVSAVGNVQIYYGGATVEADRVVYDQRTKRLRAEGNARLTEPDGKVTYGEVIDLTDDYRNGFVDSLRVETVDQTRLAASRADRSEGTHTVFQSGVYTACEACKEDPKKPPLWQVKAARIIHNQTEKMLYFEDAKIEFFGVPLAYFPYFATPDPTVKRKSGFLMPTFSYSSKKYGYALEVPYYLALAPNYDLTLSPQITSNQGPLMQAEWRHRLADGYYTVRAAGIYQLDKDAFIRDAATNNYTPGYRDFRGSIESSGQFNLTSNWVWGWDAIAATDTTFYQDYKVKSVQRQSNDGLTTSMTEGVSQLYLSGRGATSYFDARTIYYRGFSESDNQDALPLIRPVVDYAYTFGQPVLGGELSYRTNFTSLSRDSASFNAITSTASASSCANTADTAVRSNCLLRGIPGDYTRFTAEANWRKQVIDGFGQVFTPFVSVRGDLAMLSVENQTNVAQYITPGDTQTARLMPTAGLEYRYPFISVQSWGTQIFEPIAQVIVRPDEPNIGKLPNEDAQSLVFDDSNLFKVDKFSGYDRVEGGGRANVGLQYTAQFNRGGYFNVLFGQSYHLFGANSFAAGDTTNTGIDSGLDKSASDYVARVAYRPNSILSFVSRFRFDENDFTLKRLEVETTANFDRWVYSLMYGNYDAQPALGFLDRRQGILGTTSVKVTQNWVVSGGARYDLEAGKFDQTRIGLGYIDDCFMMSLNYITDFSQSGNVENNHTVSLQMSLRTIASTAGQ
jgi:LPS-assembly protein